MIQSMLPDDGRDRDASAFLPKRAVYDSRIRRTSAAERFVEIRLHLLRNGTTGSHRCKTVLVSVDDQFQPVGNTELAEDG